MGRVSLQLWTISETRLPRSIKLSVWASPWTNVNFYLKASHGTPNKPTEHIFRRWAFQASSNNPFPGYGAFQASFNNPFRGFWAFQASLSNSFRGYGAFQASSNNSFPRAAKHPLVGGDLWANLQIVSKTDVLGHDSASEKH